MPDHYWLTTARDEEAGDVPLGAVRPAGMVMRWGRTVTWCRWTGDRWSTITQSGRGHRRNVVPSSHARRRDIPSVLVD